MSAVRDSLDELVVVPDLLEALDRRIEVAEKFERFFAAYDVDAECEHGTCPGDREPQVPDCHCHGHGRECALEIAAPTQTMQSLFCESGAHWWTRPAQRGRPPKHCPEHR